MNFLDVIMPPEWRKPEVAENIAETSSNATGTTILYIVIVAAALLLSLFIARKYRKANR
ncbi:MAG: hypothetical protein IKV23_03085 [Bacteroidaceae bacterium]|nr:hypothetical protein [Bacteroidaceae bacterium]